MTDEQKAKHDSQYKELEALFIALLSSFNKGDKEEALYELSALRADQAFQSVLEGLQIDYDEALILLQIKNDENLSKYDKDLRDRLQVALANLIDFAVCEEYQLYDEVSDLVSDSEIDFNSDEYDELLSLCEKYNDTYASVENSDIAYAGVMAYRWLRMSPGDWVVYWTQNDIKVRPWHLELQGYAASADEFPSWMIPPIEWNCRCYLEYLEAGSVYAKSKLGQIRASGKSIEKPKQIGEIFNESLAKGGRIFGPSHPYFQVKDCDKEMLKDFVKRLKQKYYGS